MCLAIKPPEDMMPLNKLTKLTELDLAILCVHLVSEIHPAENASIAHCQNCGRACPVAVSWSERYIKRAR